MFICATALTVTVFGLFFTNVCGATPFSLNPKLETDCSGPPAKNQVEVIPDVSYPFRTDYLTLHEGKAYETVLCSPTVSVRCDVDYHGKTGDYVLISPFYKTYFELDCGSWNNSPGTWRSFIRDFTKKFSIISPKRALVVQIRERSDIQDPVHSDVFEPVRGQVIDLTVQAVVSTEVTAKVYRIGILPSLIALHIENGRNLTVKRHDFNRIPNVRLIVFRKSTIMEIEPYTFTDLSHLSSLSVDKGLWHVFREIDDYLFRVNIYNRRPFNNPRKYPKSLLDRPVGMWDDADLDKVHRIHCDCSFAWYRNFLKTKSELLESKQKGAMAIIGNYESQYFDLFWFDSYVASVNCAKNLTKDNYQGGDQFAYNTTCFGSC